MVFVVMGERRILRSDGVPRFLELIDVPLLSGLRRVRLGRQGSQAGDIDFLKAR